MRARSRPEGLCVRRNRLWVDRRDNHTVVGYLPPVAAVADHNTADGGPQLFGIPQGTHQVGANIVLHAPRRLRR
jgi:hypothetical protein